MCLRTVPVSDPAVLRCTQCYAHPPRTLIFAPCSRAAMLDTAGRYFIAISARVGPSTSAATAASATAEAAVGGGGGLGKAMLLWAGSGRGFRTVRTEIELPRLRDVAVGPADSNVRCVAASTASAPITDDRFLVTLIIVRSFRMARPSLLLALRAAAPKSARAWRQT